MKHSHQAAIETCELQQDQLDTLVKKTKLVITTVGPFMHYGEPVLAACVNNGTHYLDSTGEIPWIYDMIAKYETAAKKNKTIIIPECGLDSVPADIMAYVLARQVRKRYNTACERAMLTLYAFKTGISGGTSLTMLELFKKYPLSHLKKTGTRIRCRPSKPRALLPRPKAVSHTACSDCSMSPSSAASRQRA